MIILLIASAVFHLKFLLSLNQQNAMAGTCFKQGSGGLVYGVPLPCFSLLLAHQNFAHYKTTQYA